MPKLSLTRRPGETLVLQVPPGTVWREVRITVQSASRVRLDVEAPREVEIDREELLEPKEKR